MRRRKGTSRDGLEAGPRAASGGDSAPSESRRVRALCIAALLLGAGAGGFALYRLHVSSGRTPPAAGERRAESKREEGAVPPASAVPEDADREAIEALKREAIEAATRIVKEFPDQADSHLFLARVHGMAGATSKALESLERSLAIDPRRADAYVGMAGIAFSKGEFERSLSLARKALEIDPRAPGAHYSAARALLNLRRADEAIPELQKEIALTPESSLCHFLLGQAYLQRGEHEQAKRSYLKAVEVRPDFWNAYYGLMNACARLGQAEEAREYREKFKALKKDEIDDLADRTVAFDDLRCTREGLAGLHADAGSIYRRRAAGAAAERSWLRAAELDPGNIEGRKRLAELYLATGREREAMPLYERLVELEPKNGSYRLNLGILHVRHGRLEAAEAEFQKAREIDPRNAAGHRSLAEVYLKRNKLPEALALAETAVRLEPSAANYFVLGKAQDMNGDRESAIAAVGRAMELAPGNPEYRRVHELLETRR